MNKIKPITFISMMLLLSVQLWAKMEDYEYKRPLKNITEGWHSVVLPNDIFDKTQQSLNDIRIIGITNTNDTVEAPYILKVNGPKKSYFEYPFELINRVKKGKTFYFTFKTEDLKAINNIKLDFKNKNFDWHIKLLGSNNQKNWYTIVDNYRILSIHNNEVEYKYCNISFITTQYKYYQLEIPSSETPILENAKLIQQSEENGISDTIVINNSLLTITAKNLKTEIKAKLPEYIRASEIAIDVLNDFDYYRDITIKYIKDSIKTETGLLYETELLSNSNINSLEHNYFPIKSTNLNNVIISIKNDHNQPLDIDNIKIICHQHILVTRFTQEANYYLCYGKKWAGKPKYDIEKFTSQIPTELLPVKIGQEEKISKLPKNQTKSLFNKYWLWGIMILIIVLLGWSSKQLINKTKE